MPKSYQGRPKNKNVQRNHIPKKELIPYAKKYGISYSGLNSRYLSHEIYKYEKKHKPKNSLFSKYYYDTYWSDFYYWLDKDTGKRYSKGKNLNGKPKKASRKSKKASRKSKKASRKSRKPKGKVDGKMVSKLCKKYGIKQSKNGKKLTVRALKHAVYKYEKKNKPKGGLWIKYKFSNNIHDFKPKA